MQNSECLVGLGTKEIPTPALILDLDKLDFNLNLMANFMKKRRCNLRPHIKAHKSISIAALQMEKGAIGICCAKTGEAEVMAQAGIKDILVTNEIVDKRKIAVLAGLAKYANIMVLVDNKKNCEDISDIAGVVGVKIGVLVDVDT